MVVKNSYRFLSIVLAGLILFGCGKKKEKNEVVIHELSDTDMLNPRNCQSADAGYYLSQMFQPLWGRNPITLQLEPVLAKELPIEEFDEATQLLKYTFELRDDAKWDNGEPITMNDLIFSLKLYKAPQINNDQIRLANYAYGYKKVTRPVIFTIYQINKWLVPTSVDADYGSL